MNPGNQGIPNAHDTGTGALPVHDPMAPRFDHGIQNIRQNTKTAQLGANTGVRETGVRKRTEADTAQYFMMSKLSDQLYNDLNAASGGSSMMLLNAVMQNPTQRDGFVNDIQTAKNMYA